MGTEWVVGGLIAGIMLVVAASRSVAKPLRWAGLLAFHLVVGALLLFFANLAGEMAGFHIPINPVTALLAGLLRLPGLLALIFIKLYLM